MKLCPRGCGRTFPGKQSVVAHLKACDGTWLEPGLRRCPTCAEHKPLSAFVANSRNPYCKECYNAYRREMRQSNGKPTRKVCGVCEQEKGIVAFRKNGDTCRACLTKTRTANERIISPTAFQKFYERTSYADWIGRFVVTTAEHLVIQAALARYGRSGKPSADALIEAHCGPERWVEGGPPRRAAIMRHAVVLLANELARKDTGRTTRERRGPNKVPREKAA